MSCGVIMIAGPVEFEPIDRGRAGRRAVNPGSNRRMPVSRIRADVVDGAPRDFDVWTVDSDAVRAALRVRGRLDAENAELLATVIDSHIRAGRRFLRVNLAAVTELDADGMRTLEQAHSSLLAARGTLIITCVHGQVAQALVRAGLDRLLFALPPTAADKIP
jgi:anti-anti-sigma factor